MFEDPFEARLLVTMTRQGLLDALAKAGYSFPVSNETIISVEAKNGKDRVILGPKESEINIRLENQRP